MTMHFKRITSAIHSMRAFWSRKWSIAVTLVMEAMILAPSPALAASPCGNASGFNGLSNLLNVLQYIAGVLSGPIAKVIIIIAIVATMLFLFFSGDNVSNHVKVVIGFIVAVVFLFALIAWVMNGSTGAGNCNV